MTSASVTDKVTVQTFAPRILAAVRRRLPIKDIPTAFKAALDLVACAKRAGRRGVTDSKIASLHRLECGDAKRSR